MNRRIIAPTLAAMSLLASCSPVELRSDIKEFVASFSLSESMSTYVSGGYTSVKETRFDGVIRHINESLTFDMKNPENPVYEYQKSIQIGEETPEITKNFLKKIDDKIYFVEGEKEPVEYNAQQINKLFTDFFYKETLYDGAYHAQGMYYGDLLLETARELQDFITINDAKTELFFEHNSKGRVDGKDAEVKQKYSVNKLGMLIKNNVEQHNGDDYIIQEINVFKSE